MKTNDFITFLASGTTPVDRYALRKRFALAMLVATLCAAIFVIGLLGVRPDIATAAQTPLFWIKAALPALLMLGALWMTTRLARPGRSPGASWLLVAGPMLIVWIASIYLVMTIPSAQRMPLILGQTWRVCPLLIALLSCPGFIALFWAMRGLAPTRLRLAGAAAGLLAGATATLMYCLHCPEMGVPFWGCWYMLGMLIPTTVGALLGPRWLRW